MSTPITDKKAYKTWRPFFINCLLGLTIIGLPLAFSSFAARIFTGRYLFGNGFDKVKLKAINQEAKPLMVNEYNPVEERKDILDWSSLVKGKEHRTELEQNRIEQIKEELLLKKIPYNKDLEHFIFQNSNYQNSLYNLLKKLPNPSLLNTCLIDLFTKNPLCCYYTNIVLS